MKSVFDTRAASFAPEVAAKLKQAFQTAQLQLTKDRSLSDHTKTKLAKMIVSKARDRIDKGQTLEVDALASEASALIRQLQSLALLD